MRYRKIYTLVPLVTFIGLFSQCSSKIEEDESADQHEVFEVGVTGDNGNRQGPWSVIDKGGYLLGYRWFHDGIKYASVEFYPNEAIDPWVNDSIVPNLKAIPPQVNIERISDSLNRLTVQVMDYPIALVELSAPIFFKSSRGDFHRNEWVIEYPNKTAYKEVILYMRYTDNGKNLLRRDSFLVHQSLWINP